MTPGELRDVVASVADTTLSPSRSAYELSGGPIPLTRRDRTLGARQTRVLHAIQSLDELAFLAPPESPESWEAPGSWIEAGPGTWQLPVDVAANLLLSSFLHTGNWYLYLGPNAVPPSELPDTYKVQVSDVEAFMQQHELWLLLDAFHDCSEWRVFLRPDLVPSGDAT
jgi:hypothetical protein